MPMKNPNHPGDLIRDCLDELGVSVTDGAKALGVTRSALSRRFTSARRRDAARRCSPPCRTACSISAVSSCAISSV